MQSRRGPSLIRYRDGTLRPNRPRPPPGAIPTPQLSPRSDPLKESNDPISWPASAVNSPRFNPTTASFFAKAPTYELQVPTRLGLSPRHKSEAGEAIFYDTTNYCFRDGFYMPATAKASTPCEKPTDIFYRPVAPPAEEELTDGRRVEALEALVRHEQRQKEKARAQLLTSLRWQTQNMA